MAWPGSPSGWPRSAEPCLPGRSRTAGFVCGQRFQGSDVIRVLLADDQALVRGALAAMLGLEPDIEVVAEVSSGAEVLPAARRVNPDVALLDVQMPGRDGLTAAADLHRELPSCRIVVKDAPPEQLVDAVRRVHAGLRVVDPSLAAESLATGHSPLTERERDVLRAASAGGTIADVAGALHLSQGTVRNHLSSAIGKT